MINKISENLQGLKNYFNRQLPREGLVYIWAEPYNLWDEELLEW